MMQEAYISGGTVVETRATFDKLFWGVAEATETGNGINIAELTVALEEDRWMDDVSGITTGRLQTYKKIVASISGSTQGKAHASGGITSNQQAVQNRTIDNEDQRLLDVLEQARALRDRISARGIQTDSVTALEEVREGRMDELSSLH